MSNSAVGISLRNDPSKIRVEWGSLLFNMAEFVGQSLLVAPTAGGSVPDMLASAFSALKSVSMTDPVETRALGLFALALGGAVDSLTPQLGENASNDLNKLAKDVSRKLLQEVTSDRHLMDMEFFRSPSTNSLYMAVRGDISGLVAKARGQKNTAELQAKLDSAFAYSIFQGWRLRPDYFGSITSYLLNPGSELAQMQIDWAEYRAQLIESFKVKPLFGQMDQKASLSDIYVKLPGTFRTKYADGRATETKVDLHDDIGAWIEEDNSADSVRLIFGGPGSGKSSFAKALAASLAERADKRPILVELQHANALGDLRQAIEQRLVVDQEVFAVDPLSERDDNRRLVLIFDGLDELVVPGSAAASRVADGFVVSLKALLRNLNSAGKCRAKVVVTGRTAIMQSFARSLEIGDRAALEVQGFVQQDETGLTDLRPQWWAKFAMAYRHDPEVPPALKVPELKEVTSEPLLCFLLALSGYLTGAWEEAADNTNRIYDKLVGEVWERRWGERALGESGRVGPSLSLHSKIDFDLLMETMALAAWWGGESRIATKSSFDAALVATGAGDVWSKFIADEGDDLANLALTFYFRRADIDSQGFEFTHKTFGEYLVARFLMKQATGKVAVPLRSRDIDKAEASERWCRYAIQGAPNFGIAPFLQNEARLVPLEIILLSIQELQGWLAHVVRSGLPVHRRSGEEFRVLEYKNSCGHANIVACLAALSRAKDQAERNIIAWNIEVFHDEDASESCRIVRRVSEIDRSTVGVDFYRFKFGASTGGVAVNMFVPEAYFEYTDWGHMTIANGYFGASNFEGAKFLNAYVLDVGFDGCNMVDADLTGADFSGSSFRGADLRNARLDDASLMDVNLEDAEMDFGWWEKVAAETFEVPPRGNPRIWKDGVALKVGDKGYPRLTAIYSRKAATVRANREVAVAAWDAGE